MHHQKDVEQIEIIEYATDDEDISESHVTFIAKPSSPTCKTERPSQRRPSVKLTGSNLKRNDISSPVASSSPPIILNHLFGPKIVSNNRNDLYWCDLCSNSSSTKFSLERHMRQVHHNKSARSFACEFCSKTFAKKVILQNHQKIHSEYRPTVTCELCGKVLSSATALASHIRWLHCDQREFKCGNCSKMFATVRRGILSHQSLP
jgi:ribosomal protein S27E